MPWLTHKGTPNTLTVGRGPFWCLLWLGGGCAAGGARASISLRLPASRCGGGCRSRERRGVPRFINNPERDCRAAFVNISQHPFTASAKWGRAFRLMRWLHSCR